QLVPGRFVSGLDGGEAIEQLAGARVARALRGVVVELARLDLHAGGFIADAFEAEVLDQPDRATVVEPGHVLSPDQRDGVAEAPTMLRDEVGAVRVLLARHLLEDLGGLRVIRPQTLGVPAIDPRIVLLARDGERENLLLGKVLEMASVSES